MDMFEPTTSDRAVMDLLRAGVPLSLLMDLVPPEGPRSREILAAEVVPTG